MTRRRLLAEDTSTVEQLTITFQRLRFLVTLCFGAGSIKVKSLYIRRCAKQKL